MIDEMWLYNYFADDCDDESLESSRGILHVEEFWRNKFDFFTVSINIFFDSS